MNRKALIKTLIQFSIFFLLVIALCGLWWLFSLIMDFGFAFFAAIGTMVFIVFFIGVYQYNFEQLEKNAENEIGQIKHKDRFY